VTDLLAPRAGGEDVWATDAVVELTARLNGARTAQEIADAVGDVVRSAAGWFGVVLGLVDPMEAVLQQYWCAPLRDSVSARFMRVPLTLDTPQTRAVRTCTPVFIASAAELQAEFPGPFRKMSTEGLGPVTALPLAASNGRVLGALAFMWSEKIDVGSAGRSFSEAVAEVTAQAVDRVQAAARELSLAESLQSAFLTLAVRSKEVVVAAEYRSTDSALKIGGDWYDAIERPDGRVFVTVGDTVGSGLGAAATMGRLRSASGVTALQTSDPARVLQYLDEYAEHVPGATMATVAIAVYEPARHRVRYVVGGHPPPMVVRPNGRVDVLWGGRSWPLGVDLGRNRPPPASAAFPPGSTLLLYTDGLVERRDEDLDHGLRRLASCVQRHRALPVPLLLQAVLRDFGIDDERMHDDTALIALRAAGSNIDQIVDVFPARRDEVSAARHRVVAWLERAGVAAGRVADVVVALNEVIANAVEHGAGFDADALVTLEASVSDRGLIASVSDRGTWRPGVEQDNPERGRGFVLVEELSDDLHIDTGPLGTTVTLSWHDLVPIG